MKYVSIDIESTGLNPEKCQILSVGAVVEDTNNLLPLEELPTFHCAILHNEIKGEPFALNMNKDLLSKIVEYQTAEDKEAVEKKYNMLFRKEEDVVIAFYRFLVDNGVVDFEWKETGFMVEIVDGRTYPAINSRTPISHITVAGKNFATFDKFFIEKLPRWKQLLKVRQRVLDPTVLYTDWKEDEALPNLSTCKTRAGFDGHVAHDAVDDAMDVIKLMRKQYENEN